MNIVLSKTMKVVAAGILSAIFLTGYASQSMAADKPMETANADEMHVSGSLTFHGESINLIAGGTWGEGVLSFEGKQYKFKAKSLGAGYSIGVKETDSKAIVYDLKDIKDFAGSYWGVKAGGTLFYGAEAANVQNSKGVMLNITGTSEGAAVDIAAGLKRIVVELVE